MPLAKFDLDDGGSVLVEVGENDLGVQRVARDAVVDASERLEEAVGKIRPVAQAVLDAMSALKPEKVTVEFGIKLNVQAGAIIAKTEAEGHFTVTIEWQPEQTRQPDHTGR